MRRFSKLFSEKLRPVNKVQCCTKSLGCGEGQAQITARPFEEMPGPPGLPLIGNLLQYSIFGPYEFKKLHLANLDKYRKYGKIVKEGFGGGRFIVHLFDPADIETMYRQEGKYPFRPPFEPVVAHRKSKNMPIGIGHLQGEDWYNLRNIIQKVMLHPGATTPYLEQQDKVAKDFVGVMLSLLRSDGEIDHYHNWLQKWALESIAVVLFDTRLGCIEPNVGTEKTAQDIVDAASTFFHSIYETMMGFPWWKYFSTPAWKRLTRNHDFLFKTAQTYVDATIESMEKAAKGNKVGNVHGHSFLEALLQTKGLDRVQACLIAIELMISGIETTASCVSFMLYNLAKSQDVQEKLYKEICSILPDEETPLSSKALMNAHYLRAVFKETSRINPVTNGTVRVLDHDVVFSGFKVPAWTAVMSHTLVLGRLPQYFEEPDQFLPERWMDRYTNPSSKTSQTMRSHPFAMTPFGYGTRMCIGRRFALQEIFLGITRIIKNFKVEYHHKEEVGLITHILNVPDRPIRLRFIKR